ncbi:MAG: hypothetical protein RXQ94_08460 [Caldivirga sp.]
MVYVSINVLEIRRGLIYIEMSVFGMYPKDAKEVMETLTQVFSKLVFKYPFSGKLHKLSYYFDVLAKKKVYVASIPDPENERIVYLFVDAGSFLKNFYIAASNSTSGYIIFGRDYPTHEDIIIYIDFASEPPRCTAAWCTGEFMERMEKLMKDNEIHVEPYPGMRNRVKKLLEKAIELAKESGSRYKNMS